jgi:hypothetical protein
MKLAEAAALRACSGIGDNESMNCGAIISKAESLQILRNDLRKAALEQHAAELAKTTEARRQEMLAQINREIEEELHLRRRRIAPNVLLY